MQKNIFNLKHILIIALIFLFQKPLNAAEHAAGADADGEFFRSNSRALTAATTFLSNLENSELVIRTFNRERVDIHSINYLRYTRLMGAVLSEDPDAVGTFLREGDRVNDRDRAGNTALMKAAFVGNRAIVDMLLGAGAAIDAADLSGKTPPMWAALGGHGTILSIFLAAGAAVNAVDARGRTPLMMAAEGGHASTVASLVAAGADVNAVDARGLTPLMWAASKRGGDGRTVASLVAAGAAVNAVDAHRETPLWKAAERGCGHSVGILLRAGADARFKRSAHGREMLSWVISMSGCGDKDSYAHTVALLAEAGADVNHQEDLSGETPLMQTAVRGNLKLGYALLEAGANVHMVDNKGRTVLTRIVETQYRHLIFTLRGAASALRLPIDLELNLRKVFSMEQFMDALYYGYDGLVRDLGKLRIDLNTKLDPRSDATPLSLIKEHDRELMFTRVLMLADGRNGRDRSRTWRRRAHAVAAFYYRDDEEASGGAGGAS